MHTKQTVKYAVWLYLNVYRLQVREFIYFLSFRSFNLNEYWEL